MKKTRYLVVLCLMVICLLSSMIHADEKKVAPKEFVVEAGSGLKAGLDAINVAFEKKYGDKVLCEYLCSAMVITNLLLSHAADVFVPGDEKFMNIAVEKGAVRKDTIRPAGYMIPAITVMKGNPKKIKTLKDLAKPGIKVGLGEFETVASGRMAKVLLEDAGLLDAVKKNLVYTGASATKLQTVMSLGHLDAAINWIPIILEFKETEYVEIPLKQLRYSIAPCGLAPWTDERGTTELGLKYINFISSEEGQKIMEEQGYLMLNIEKAKKVE